MRRCLCCVTESDRQTITAKIINQLTANDLNHFALKVMTTWETVEDFKHFSPRLFKLLPSDRSLFLASVVRE